MMKHWKKILLGILTLLAVGFFAQEALLDSAAASAASRTPDLVAHRALVMPEKGVVEMRQAGSGEWKTITEETLLSQGDSVRTGEDASASLNLFEQGAARLGPNASITLESLAWDEEKNSFVGKILVESGRLWSRLLDFMAPESAYEVRTPHLVATVRGTAFFVDASAVSNDVYVADHLVSVALASGAANADVSKGKNMHFIVPPSGALPRLNAPAWTIKDAKEMGEDPWVRANVDMDASFKKRVEERLQGDLERFVPRPDMSVRIEAKERATISKKGPEAERAAVRGLSRLVAEMLAAAVRNDAAAATALMVRTESFCAHARQHDAACKVHPRLVEAIAHRSDLTALLQEAALRASPDMAETLRRVLERRSRFETSAAPASADAPIIETSATLEIREGGETIAPAVPPVPTAAKPVRLEIAAERFIFGYGESGTFSAFLRWSDGRSQDVTKSTIWSIVTPSGTPPFGQMRSNLFQAGEIAGSTSVTASFTHDLGIFTASDTIHVTRPSEPIVN